MHASTCTSECLTIEMGFLSVYNFNQTWSFFSFVMKYHIPIWQKGCVITPNRVPSIRQILGIIERILLTVNDFLQAFYAAT